MYLPLEKSIPTWWHLVLTWFCISQSQWFWSHLSRKVHFEVWYRNGWWFRSNQTSTWWLTIIIWQSVLPQTRVWHRPSFGILTNHLHHRTLKLCRKNWSQSLLYHRVSQYLGAGAKRGSYSPSRHVWCNFILLIRTSLNGAGGSCRQLVSSSPYQKHCRLLRIHLCPGEIRSGTFLSVMAKPHGKKWHLRIGSYLPPGLFWIL